MLAQSIFALQRLNINTYLSKNRYSKKVVKVNNPQTEIVAFSSPDVTVTSSRFVVKSQTYAIRNITSVDFLIKKAPKWVYAIIAAITLWIGLPIGHPEPNGLFIIIGIVFLFYAILSKHKYFVILRSSAGEVRALESTDKVYIQTVVTALNNAIIYQGR